MGGPTGFCFTVLFTVEVLLIRIPIGTVLSCAGLPKGLPLPCLLPNGLLRNPACWPFKLTLRQGPFTIKLEVTLEFREENNDDHCLHG